MVVNKQYSASAPVKLRGCTGRYPSPAGYGLVRIYTGAGNGSQAGDTLIIRCNSDYGA